MTLKYLSLAIFPGDGEVPALLSEFGLGYPCFPAKGDHIQRACSSLLDIVG